MKSYSNLTVQISYVSVYTVNDRNTSIQNILVDIIQNPRANFMHYHQIHSQVVAVSITLQANLQEI